jgi:hypothetical protein
MNTEKVKKSIYNAAQWTWGLPQTLAGAALYLRRRKDPHFDYNGAKVTAWDRDSGVSLGKFIFVPAEKRREAGKSGEKKSAKEPVNVSRFLLDHEYGHTIQSLILGPAYFPLVGIPSFIWNRLPYFEWKRKKTGTSYYSAVFERTASSLGERFSGRRRKK